MAKRELMDYFVRRFNEPTANDDIRIFQAVWRKRSDIANVKSLYGMVVIGYPAKQIEWLSLGTHRIFSN